MDLESHGIYLQALQEDEGQQVWRSDDRLLALVWDSEAALQAAQQPMLLKCRITTSKAGPDSELRGTNQSAAPVAGFQAVIWDEVQLAALPSSSSQKRSPVKIWSGREVNVYDFEFPTQRADSSQVDGLVRPKYQFHLEVEDIVFPQEGSRPADARLVWTRESFAVAEGKESARLEPKPGYFADPDVRQGILNCLGKVLLVDPAKAKVLPFSEMDRFKVGKRVSNHPLHDTYIGKESRERRDNFYAVTAPGTLVAEIDERAEGPQEQGALFSVEMPVPRVQKVFTMPMQDLKEIWASIARLEVKQEAKP